VKEGKEEKREARMKVNSTGKSGREGRDKKMEGEKGHGRKSVQRRKSKPGGRGGGQK